MKLKKNFDLLFALTCALISGSTVLFAYAGILKVEEPDYLLNQPLQQGKQTYLIMQHTTCVGHFSTELEHDDTFSLTSQGTLFVTYNGKPTSASVLLKAIFNPLGQLTNSITHINTPAAKLNIRTDNVNPIAAALSLTVQDKKLEHTLTFPGPLLIKESTPSRYSLSSALAGSDTMPFQQLTQSLQRRFNLNLKEVQATEAACEGSQNTFNLDALVSELDSSVKAWSTLINFLSIKGLEAK